MEKTAVGKTIVSSSIIDRVAARLGRRLVELPVGFKYFVDGLLSGSLGFGGEESAGASFLRRAGTAWATDKDGLVIGLLAAEMTRAQARILASNISKSGPKLGEQRDVPATRQAKATLARLSAKDLGVTELAGQRVIAAVTRAPGNGEPIGRIKVIVRNGWLAARPSGTEDVYKLYAESFRCEDQLRASKKGRRRPSTTSVIGSAIRRIP